MDPNVDGSHSRPSISNHLGPFSWEGKGLSEHPRPIKQGRNALLRTTAIGWPRRESEWGMSAASCSQRYKQKESYNLSSLGCQKNPPRPRPAEAGWSPGGLQTWESYLWPAGKTPQPGCSLKGNKCHQFFPPSPDSPSSNTQPPTPHCSC